MKRVTGPMDWLDKLFIGGLLAIFGLIVLQAPIGVFFGTLAPHYALEIKAWKELVMGALLVLAAVIVTLRGAWQKFLRDPIILVSLALALVYALSVQYGHGFKPYGAGLLIDLRYILYGLLVYVAIRLFPESRRQFVRVALVGAIIVVAFGLLQFVLPRDFLSILGYSKSTITPYTTIDNYEGLVRLQSTMRGPNPLGAYAMIVALVAGVAAVKRGLARQQRILLGILTVGALIVMFGSYSRSAYIGFIVGGVIAAALIAGRRLRTRKAAVAGLIAIVIVITGLVAIRNTTFFTSVLRHEVAGSGPAINSDEGHSLSLKDGIAAVAAHPFGYGTGSTGSASLLSTNGYIVENQYLYVAHEAGWLALALFLILIVILLQRVYVQQADPLALGVFVSGIGLLIVGMLLPVFADDTVSIVWFGLAGLIAGGHDGKRATK